MKAVHAAIVERRRCEIRAALMSLNPKAQLTTHHTGRFEFTTHLDAEIIDQLVVIRFRQEGTDSSGNLDYVCKGGIRHSISCDSLLVLLSLDEPVTWEPYSHTHFDIRDKWGNMEATYRQEDDAWHRMNVELQKLVETRKP